MKFRNWADNGTLALDHYLLPNFPGYDRIKALPLRQQEVFVDSFFQVTGTHRFNLCRPEATGYEIDFSDDSWKNWRPVRRFNLRFQKLSEPEKGPIAVWARNRNVFGANLFCHALLEGMNGENTSAQCIAEAKSRLPVHPEDPEKHTRDFLSDMWQRGHIYFCKV